MSFTAFVINRTGNDDAGHTDAPSAHMSNGSWIEGIRAPLADHGFSVELTESGAVWSPDQVRWVNEFIREPFAYLNPDDDFYRPAMEFLAMLDYAIEHDLRVRIG